MVAKLNNKEISYYMNLKQNRTNLKIEFSIELHIAKCMVQKVQRLNLVIFIPEFFSQII